MASARSIPPEILVPATTPADVKARLRAIDAALRPEDGVAWFNRLYMRVTDAVAEASAAGTFEDPAFIDDLDVRFVDLYLDALRAGLDDPSAAPAAWRPLFAARDDRRIAPIQFALAGMNAHINRDLVFALEATRVSRGIALTRDSPQRRDFERVNAVLAGVERTTKVWFDTGFPGLVDRQFGRVDDVVAIWSMTEARDAAWRHAEIVATLDGSPPIAAAYLDTLDRIVGLASRGLLLVVA